MVENYNDYFASGGEEKDLDNAREISLFIHTWWGKALDQEDREDELKSEYYEMLYTVHNRYTRLNGPTSPLHKIPRAMDALKKVHDYSEQAERTKLQTYEKAIEVLKKAEKILEKIEIKGHEDLKRWQQQNETNQQLLKELGFAQTMAITKEIESSMRMDKEYDEILDKIGSAASRFSLLSRVDPNTKRSMKKIEVLLQRLGAFTYQEFQTKHSLITTIVKDLLDLLVVVESRQSYTHRQSLTSMAGGQLVDSIDKIEKRIDQVIQTALSEVQDLVFAIQLEDIISYSVNSSAFDKKLQSFRPMPPNQKFQAALAKKFASVKAANSTKKPQDQIHARQKKLLTQCIADIDKYIGQIKTSKMPLAQEVSNLLDRSSNFYTELLEELKNIVLTLQSIAS